jgi:hypothetical protein
MQTIHGPVNYFKISGEIDGNNKTIHCFCDKHIPFEEPQSFNKNETLLEPFLNDLFSNTKLNWDFMIEADTLEKQQEKNPELYLTRIRNYAHSLKASNMYSNVRVHHIDIRWIFSKYLGNDFILEQVKSGTVEAKIKTNGIEPIQKYFRITSDRIKVVILILKGEEFKPTCEYEELVYKIINKIIRKIILCKSDKLKEYLNEMLNYNIQKLESLSNDLLNIKTFSHVLTSVTMLHTHTAFLMDMYVLRRILDKDYVENVILYCGSYHAYSLIISLENNFNFEVDYVSKNPFDKTDNYTDILNLLVVTPRIKEQWVTLDNESF